MKKILVLAITAVSIPTMAQEVPSPEALWEIIQQQQAEIENLRDLLSNTSEDLEEANERIDDTEEMVVATTDYIDEIDVTDSRSWNIGGYGELHYNNLSADNPAGKDVHKADMHRFVLFVSNEFSDRVNFFSEFEVEHSLAGDGKPGEVEIEQAYLDIALNDNLNAQTGLFLVPVGIMNETHEPPTFYGVERNDVENIIVPATWWEAGAGLSGNFSNGFSWNAAIHSGLEMPTTGSSAFRVRSGRQKVANAIAKDLATTFRVRYTGIPGLDLSAAFQHQSDPSQVAGDGLDSGRLFVASANYQADRFQLRAVYGQWAFDGFAVEKAGVDDQSGWYVEPSFRLNPKWGIYSRYEDLNGARVQDVFTEWEYGFNYYVTDSTVLKFDYRVREHGLAAAKKKDFKGFDLGVGYMF